MRLLRIQRCFYGFLYVTEEDSKFFSRNLLACLQEDTSLLRLLRVARWGLQIIKYFLHRHKKIISFGRGVVGDTLLQNLPGGP